MSPTWRTGRVIVGVLLLAASGASGAAGARTWEPDRISPQDLVSRSAAALGSPEARAEATGFSAELSGTSFRREQARDPAEEFGATTRVYRWRFDQGVGSLIRETELVFPGGIEIHERTALTPAGGWIVDPARSSRGDDLLTIGAPGALRTRLDWERAFPHLLLSQASRREVTSSGPFGFQFTDASGAVVKVALDPATLLPSTATMSVNGTLHAEYRYLDYELRHGVRMPGRLQTHSGGRLQEEVRLGSTALARLSEQDLLPPAGYAPPPPPAAPEAREIAPGIFFFDNMPGGYHSMMVDAGDHLILLEAPHSPSYAELQRSILERLRPGTPVRYVLATHPHSDHVGGVSAWAAWGATIVVADGGRVALDRQLRAGDFAGSPLLEEVSGRRTFGSPANPVRAHAVVGDHSAANLVFHLPAARLLFQGDFLSIPERGGTPVAFPVASELRRAINTLGLDVERIAGVHGRPVTAAEFNSLVPLEP